MVWDGGRALLSRIPDSSVQISHSVVSILCDSMNRSTPGLPVHHQLPESTKTHVRSVGDAMEQSHPLFSPSTPALNLSQYQRLSNESALHIRWPKYWSFGFSISASMNTQDWFPLGWTGWMSLQSKGLSRVLSNTTVQKHQFLGAQLSSQSNSHIHTWPYGKTIALTRRTFVGKVMSLLLNMLSRLVITFLPRSKHLLISWLQSPSAVILEPPKIKSDTVSTVCPSISHKVMGPDATILIFWMLA